MPKIEKKTCSSLPSCLLADTFYVEEVAETKVSVWTQRSRHELQNHSVETEEALTVALPRLLRSL